MTASTLRSLGYRRTDCKRDAPPVRGNRYLVTNGRGQVELAIWDTGVGDDGEADCWFDLDGEFLGTAGQWAWFKELQT